MALDTPPNESTIDSSGAPTTITPVNPFALLTDPHNILQGVRRSDKLNNLPGRVCGLMDTPTISPPKQGGDNMASALLFQTIVPAVPTTPLIPGEVFDAQQQYYVACIIVTHKDRIDDIYTPLYANPYLQSLVTYIQDSLGENQMPQRLHNGHKSILLSTLLTGLGYHSGKKSRNTRLSINNLYITTLREKLVDHAEQLITNQENTKLSS